MVDVIHWNDMISSLPGRHLLQTWEWGQLKSQFGWYPLGFVWYETNPGMWKSFRVQFLSPQNLPQYSGAVTDGYAAFSGALPSTSHPQAAALVLQRTLTFRGFASRIRIWYSPKGPLLDWSNAPLRKTVLDDLVKYTRQSTAIFIKLDPDVRLGVGIPGLPEASDDLIGQEVVADLIQRGWQYSSEQIQFRNTVLLDLSLSEEDLLQRMKPKTRYNIRLAQRKGVTIRVGSQADRNLLYRMYVETSLRDGFVIRDGNYYKALWERFSNPPLEWDHSRPEIETLLAETDGEPIAAVVVYRFAGKAYYLSGMSKGEHREMMPNYLLQWEAICRAKKAGCAFYDMWGAPEQFTPADPLWGVYRFKEGFSGEVIRTLGAWDNPTRKTTYRIYTQLLPRVLGVMRRQGISRTRQITP